MITSIGLPPKDCGIQKNNDSTFRFFPQLNEVEYNNWLSSGNRLRNNTADKYFPNGNLQEKVVRAIIAERVINIKEILEAFEFFARIRKKIKSKCVVDLCCGHGFVGILFAIFERKVEKVILVDKVEPTSRKKLINCLTKVTPWIVDKVESRNESIHSELNWLEEGSTIVSAHACGTLTDRCIELAINCKGNIAVLPCCYPDKACPAPQAIGLSLGNDVAFDIDRTYRLSNVGYHAKWQYIPRIITPKNRILYAYKK